MAADQIIMDENAVLGPVDPQLGQWPAVSILAAVETVGQFPAGPSRHQQWLWWALAGGAVMVLVLVILALLWRLG